MKKIDTLIEDIEATLLGQNGWDEAVGKAMAENIAWVAKARFSKPQKPRGYLSLSSVGTPCQRKLWHRINRTELAEKTDASGYLKFFYGDMVEELILSLARISGHKVEGTQSRMYVAGIRGHRDAVIDGMTVDVKTTTDYGFKKFKENSLRDDDAFGYISQLSSYVYAGKDDPLVTDKNRGAFLVVNKVTGEMVLDIYDFTDDIKNKEVEVEGIKEMISADEPPAVPYEPVPQSDSSPNLMLPKDCGWCEFKKLCYPNLRKFMYANGKKAVYLTKVVKLPNVPEDLTFNEEE